MMICLWWGKNKEEVAVGRMNDWEASSLFVGMQPSACSETVTASLLMGQAASSRACRGVDATTDKLSWTYDILNAAGFASFFDSICKTSQFHK